MRARNRASGTAPASMPADVHMLDPVAAHHQRREVAAAGEHQADAAARQRCRGAEHQRHEPRGAVGRGRVQHRRVEQLQQPHRVVLHAAAARAPTGGPGPCSPRRRRPCRTRRPAGRSWRCRAGAARRRSRRRSAAPPRRAGMRRRGSGRAPAAATAAAGWCATRRPCAPGGRRALRPPSRCPHAGRTRPPGRRRGPSRWPGDRGASRTRTSAPAGTPLPGSDTTAPTAAEPRDDPDRSGRQATARCPPTVRRPGGPAAAVRRSPDRAARPPPVRAVPRVRRGRSAPSRTVPRPPTRPRPRPSTTATRPRPPAPARRRPARPPSSPSARGAGTGPSFPLAEARNRDRDRSTSRVSSRPCCSVTSSTYQAAQPSGRSWRRARNRLPPDGELDLARCVTRRASRSTARGSSAPTSSSPTRRFGSRADAVAFTKRITPWSSWARMPLPAPSRSWSARVRRAAGARRPTGPAEGDRPVRVDVMPLLDHRDPPVAGCGARSPRAGCVGVDQVTRS